MSSCISFLWCAILLCPYVKCHERSIRCEVSQFCPEQPDVVMSLYDRLNKSTECIFKTITTGCNVKSSYRTQEKNSIPDSQGWTYCHHCVWKGNSFHSIMSDGSSSKFDVDLSWSSWGEFFFNRQEDQFKSKTDAEFNFSAFPTVLYVDRPVFIVPMITFHVGHIIIDILEQVYAAMILIYGNVRKDALIIIDVAGSDEQQILQEKLFLNAFVDNYDTFGVTLRLLSDLPAFSMDLLRGISAQGTPIIFDSVHIGADLSQSFFAKGYDNHPCIFDVGSGLEIRQLATRYQQFHSFVHGIYALKGFPELHLQAVTREAEMRKQSSHFNVLFIQRKSNRVILNIDELENYVTRRGLHPSVKDLAYLSFTEQLHEFAKADIMIATAGTAIHNILFMRPGSVVIILMQSGWCDWAWMYANQAVLLDIHPIVYCPQEAGGSAGTPPPSSISQSAISSSSPLENLSDDRRDAVMRRRMQATAGAVEQLQSRQRVEIYDGEDPTLLVRPGVNAFHWTRRFWRQGPKMTKSEDIVVDVSIFRTLIDTVIAKMQSDSVAQWNVHNQPICTGRNRISRTPGPPATQNERETPPAAGRTSESLVTNNADNITGENDATNARSAFNVNSANNANNASSLPLHRPRQFFQVRTPAVEAYLTAVSSEQVGESEWQLKLMGEIASRNQRNSFSAGGYEGMPHLSICCQSLLTNSPPWCYPIAALNYHSDILITVTAPVHHFHFWAQASAGGGKFAGSDTFVTLDTRVDDTAGSSVYVQPVGMTVTLQMELFDAPAAAAAAAALSSQDPNQNQPHQPESGLRTFNSTLVSIQLPLRTAYTLQRFTTDFCRTYCLQPRNCGEVAARLATSAYQNRLAEQLGLPRVQLIPTPTRPFVFLHIEKVGGTTLREFIVESAEELGVDYFVPCHGPVHCVTLHLLDTAAQSDLSHVSVVAGHFSWGVWRQLPAFKSLTEGQGTKRGLSCAAELSESELSDSEQCRNSSPIAHSVTSAGTNDASLAFTASSSTMSTSHHHKELRTSSNPAPVASSRIPPPLSSPSITSSSSSNNNHNPSVTVQAPQAPACFLMGRHPVERSISYYYQRCYSSSGCLGSGRMVNELSIDELEAIAVGHREAKHKEDNVTLVVLDDGMSEATCRALANAKITTGKVVGVDVIDIPPSLTQDQIDLALSRVEHCVVGILERWKETKQVAAHWFPWLDLATKDPNRRKMYLYSNKETVETLRLDLRQKLLELNRCDMLVYTKMLSIFERELSVVHTTAFQVPPE